MIGAAQIEAFARDGFLAVAALTDAREIAALRGCYDALFERASGFARGDRLELLVEGKRSLLAQIVNPERYAPQLLQGQAFRTAQVVARQLLGEPCEAHGHHAILKPAAHGAATPWHQDEAYWDPRYAYRALSVWMPLQPATLANGCMQFIAGSHRGAVLAHELVAADSHALRLVRAGTPGVAIACEIPAGGATIHHSRALHYAGANLSGQPRRALVFGFRAPPTLLRRPMSYPWQRPEWFGDSIEGLQC